MANKSLGDQKQGIYQGPLYSNGTTQMDSKENMGKVEGPKGGMKTPDPIGYDVDRNRKGSK